MNIKEKYNSILEELDQFDELKVSRENKKLVPNETTAFIIWNLPAVFTCPYRTALCENACYAIKAELQYPDCLPARQRNFNDSMRDNFVNRMIKTISRIAKGTRKKEIIVRIHESGDFYNRAYVNKWLQIIAFFAFDKRIKFIAYSKSFVFFDGLNLPKNFFFRASIWADTKPEQLEIVRRNHWKIYTAVDKFRKGDKFTRCRCKNCATCKKCWQSYQDIRCEIH